MDKVNRRSFAVTAALGAVFAPSIALAAAPKNVRSVAVLGDVAAASVAIGDCLYVAGRNAIGDGFEGLFVARAKAPGETADQVLRLASSVDTTLLWERQITDRTYLSSWWVPDRSTSAAACNQALNAMFGAIPASDCTVVFSSGTYKLGDFAGWQPVTMQGKSRIAVVADGRALITTSGLVPSAAIAAFGTPMMVARNCHACRIEGLVFDGAAGGASAASIGAFCLIASNYSRLIGLEGSAFGSVAIFSEVACEGSSWEGCHAHDSVNNARGFWLGHQQTFGDIGSYLSRDLKVHGCRALNNDYTGFVINSDGATVTGNTSSYNNGSGIISPSLDGYLVRRHAIVGNVCQGNAFYGYQTDVYAVDPAYYPTQLTVSSNVFNENAAGGMLLNKCREVLATGNVCSRSGPGSPHAYGIQVEGTSASICVVGNSCDDDRSPPSQSAGITIFARAGVAMQSVTVTGNSCIGNGIGIQAEHLGANATLTGVNISGNSVRNNTEVGIRLAQNGSGFSDLVVNGNNCSSNSLDLRCTVAGAKVRGNTYSTFTGTTGVPYPIYASEAAATSGGLKSGEEYRTATGELRVKL